MTRYFNRCLLLLALLLAGCDSELNTSCKLVWRADMPITIRNGMILVEAQFNDQPATMILDTGAERTVLTQDAVTRLRLRRDLRHLANMGGIGGANASYQARLDSFEVGVFHLAVDTVTVGTFSLPALEGTQPDGLLGAEILLAFDLDINLPAQRLTIYRQRPCPDSRPPWTEPYTTITGVGMLRDRLTVPLTLNGAKGTLVLDTGAGRSTIGTDFAARAGVTQGMLDADRTLLVSGASREQARVYLHRFDSIGLGDGVEHGVVLAVSRHSSALGDGLLGEDFLHGRRIWISFASHQLFVTGRAP